MNRKYKVLLIEDEKNIARNIQLELEHEGYIVDVKYNGQEGLDFFKRFDADLILLDLMLPVMDGFEVLKEVRKISDTPVIMLTARDDIPDKVKSLDLGADDYITKPFMIEELLARIRNKISKHKGDSSGKRIVISGLSIDLNLMQVSYLGEVIDLTKREYELIKYLAERKNEVVPRDEIFSEVWGYDYIGESNVVDVYVRYLRQKIDSRIGKKIIHTVRGVGYCIKDE